MGDDHAAGLAGPATEDLLRRFLDRHTPATARAYTADLADLARFLGTSLEAAVGSLLLGPEPASRRLLDYALELRRRGLAPATARRRLGTLRALLATARELGLVDWSLELPTPEEVEAARERSREPKAPYLMPRHPDEVDRLDLQHFALREALGANFLAPVEGPARVLDVGTGTGQWGFEVAHQFPGALVVGFDLVRGKPDPPPGYRHVRGNLLQGLPFRDGIFDFVHQRFLTWGIPVDAWPGAVRELVRVTRPGGWVELVEITTRPQRMGPATRALFDLVHRQLADPLGLDTTDAVFRSLDEHLREAGLDEIVRRERSLPVGEWGGGIGAFMATDARTAGLRFCELLRSRSPGLAADAAELLRRSLEELDRHQTIQPLAIVYGRKPA
jgi:ubiquinone/menaquinone biosynthesis C-methylase UbiE